jgi:GT2 family glycosyltransferase
MPKSGSNDEQSSLHDPVGAPATLISQSGMPNPPLIYVLVLHWRGIDNTRNCLSSLRLLNYSNFKTLLVDNGSDNNDGETLKAEFNEIELLRLDDNYGFSGGCNAGIDFCLTRGPEFIWLLNNDATVEADTLSQLSSACRAHPHAGAASAAVVDSTAKTKNARLPQPTSTLSLSSVSTASTVSTVSIIPGRGVLDFRQAKALLKQAAAHKAVECDWLAASNLLLRVEAIKQTGAFDSRYFLYFEDTELCYKLRHAGWTCLLVPEAHIFHIGNASTGDSLQHWRAYYYTRNRLLFFASYTKFPLSLLAFASIYWHLLRHSITLPFRGRARVRQLRAELFGLRDFLRGSFGKCTYIDKI